MAHILLIEDVDDVLYILSRMLERLGHDVLKAANGEQGLAAIRTRSLDAAITDLWMPGGDGIEFIRAAKALKPWLPVVAITGGAPQRPLEMSLERARQAGADATLLKPVERRELQTVLVRLLQTGQHGNAAETEAARGSGKHRQSHTGP